MTLDLDALRVFVRVAELRSFSRAAEQLGMPRSRASAHVQRLEAGLGTQLLQRSTRVVRPTPEGEELLARSRALLAEADALAALFRADQDLQGRVRMELPVAVARDHVIPRLPELFGRHPLLQVDVRANDRLSAALRDGLDLVLRVGPALEPGLVGRRLGVAPMMNCASPRYLRERGTPRTLEDLRHHVVVHYAADPTPSFEYAVGGTYQQLPMRSLITVDAMETYEAAGVAGLGIVQLPRQGRPEHDLVEILPEYTASPVPVTLLHTHGSSAPRRVGVVMSWLAEVLSPLVREHLSPK